ncbi:uncharacterized protein OCT59_016084 [Rhizophagus irregularis]|uniref:Uncharacterized protein n=1 Tax=Rhizophagus irregularis (strain DAOM 181602 / DAOM 197198 / MUCL 43194) TaxID=747089 RepID=U9U5J0_RHIID|nr:hypothetical protein OCT59_016084 [Rhizophagus irregularis]GBC30984.1 hypothetical protein RIR_jg31481.t1 [Rhizophagus irregularis DAOM 181602=DAOM 197198]
MPRNTRKAAQRIFQAKETSQEYLTAEEKGIYEQYDTDRRWIENKQASSSYSENGGCEENGAAENDENTNQNYGMQNKTKKENMLKQNNIEQDTEN